MDILGGNISVLKKVGEVSKERLGKVQKALDVYDKMVLDNGGTGLLFGEQLNSSVAVTPTQIIYLFKGPQETMPLADATKCLSGANLALSLEDKGEFVLAVEFIKKQNKDIMEHSLSFIPGLERHEGVLGLGLKLMIRDNNYIGEIEIEPYVKQSSCVYYSLTLKRRGLVKVSEGLLELQNMFAVVTKRLAGIESLLSISDESGNEKNETKRPSE